jgi:hypothetical protein
MTNGSLLSNSFARVKRGRKDEKRKEEKAKNEGEQVNGMRRDVMMGMKGEWKGRIWVKSYF